MRSSPVALPGVLALGLCAWWALDGGGFAVAQWGPGGLALLGLLGIAVVGVPWRRPGGLVLGAAALLAAYAAWSLASIVWAGDPGAALQGGTRTVLSVAAFCLFALWPVRGRVALALLGTWMALLTVAGLVLAVRLRLADDPATLFNFDRLRAPTGYPNATAALLLMPVVPGVVLAAARPVPWWARGPAAAAATGLASLAVLALSRGAVFSLPLVLLALLVAVPDRVRHLYAALAVAAGVAVCAPRLLDVGDVIDTPPGAAALHAALWPAGLAALAVGAVVAAAAWAERPGVVGMRTRGRVGVAARAGAVLLAVAALGLAIGLSASQDPVSRADDAWRSFKGGYAENDPDANRLVGGLGSARYDFYRVGIDTWTDHPWLGVGADNFYAEYLRAGTSAETPSYPHSLEVRTLAQTGLVGAALLAAALACAGLAALRRMRDPSPWRRAAAAGGAMAFAWWLVHGSVDWFWEWTGLSVPAFALLGLACARGPGPGAGEAPAAPKPPALPGAPAASAGAARAPTARGDRPARGRAARAVAVAAIGLAAVPLAALWASDREQRRAAAVFATDPLTAYDRLDRARDLDPLSAAPDTLAGSIALRFGDLARADAAFARALDRVPDDEYATLERGAIASAEGRRGPALALLRRAVALAPRDAIARDALAAVRGGATIDIAALNARILAGTAILRS